MFETIIFGDRETNKPLQCYKVGLMGCKSITEIEHESTGGLGCFSYRVEFESGPSVEVRDTLMVTDNGLNMDADIVRRGTGIIE